MCTRAGVPLVYNESAAMFFRYHSDTFSASGRLDLEPDATIASLGGQMALALLRRSLFIEAPLKLISTWEGDGFSLAKFAAVTRCVMKDIAGFMKLTARFIVAIESELSGCQHVTRRLNRGCGWIEGDLPNELTAMLTRNVMARWLLCPSPSAMHQFVERSG
jgi:hypothetical protein